MSNGSRPFCMGSLRLPGNWLSPSSTFATWAYGYERRSAPLPTGATPVTPFDPQDGGVGDLQLRNVRPVAVLLPLSLVKGGSDSWCCHVQPM
jgi:hypothetical protein